MVRMKVCLTVAIISSILGVGFSQQCPTDWIQFNNHCYLLSSTGLIPLSWHEAQTKCETMRGTLAIVDTAEENTFLYNQMTEYTNYYIGLHDLNGENSWQWVDGNDLSNFVFWAPGQPDNYENALGSQEDCVQMNWDQGGAWNDLACALRSSFICERDINLDPLPECLESEGWKQHDDRCYKTFNDKKPWTAAEEHCVSVGGHLVGIATNDEQLFVSNEVNVAGSYLWIGLSSVDDMDHNLHWSNDVDNYPGYANWGDGEPNLPTNNQARCVGVDPSISLNGPWTVKRCGESQGFMCETGKTGSCAPGWYLYKGTCYFQASSQELWTTWVGARDYCANMGAALVQIASWEMQEYVTSRLPDIEDGGSNDMWIGVSDSETDGNFVWLNGMTPDQVGFSYWQENQPNDRNSAWDCGQIYTGSSWGGWETDDCFKTQAFMCQIGPGEDVGPATGPPQTGCDPGWLFFDNHCYYFEYTKLVPWFQAESNCASYGGHLVSILSGDENAFVVGHASASSWIGAHDNQGEGRFEWSDASPFGDFTNWYEGEPNNNGGEGDCAQFWMEANFAWDDISCNNLRPYICKATTHECDQALGMEDNTILDSQITASSQWDENHASYLARLNNGKSGDSIGAWVPAKVGDSFPAPGSMWIQVHLVPRRSVTAITTQGRPADYIQYVMSYQIKYSDDGVNFVDVGQTFTANNDPYTPVTNRLSNSIVTSYIRLYPMTWNESPTLRMEISGCNDEGENLSTPSPHTECTSIAVSERLDCGYPGISGQECLNKGCCWDNTQPAVWCFYKKSDYDPRCGRDWQFDPSGQFLCYHFNDVKRRNWVQAREECFSMGGDLLSINSAAEQAFVTSHLSYYILTNAMWMGANSRDDEKGWSYSNGVPFNFVNWNNGEPNGFENGEKCVEIYTGSGFWNDLYCDHEKGFACKKFANIAPPDVSEDGNVQLDICEGESRTLTCLGNTVITIHHAKYGRSNDFTCGEGNLVPEQGCNAVNSLDVVSKMCNNRQSCTIEATNEVFGDPCHETYKYLNVIYSCEFKSCYNPIGVENGTIADSQMSASSYLDNNHRAYHARLNADSSWATQEGSGAWIQVTFPTNKLISGVIMQGAHDQDFYVTKYKVAIAHDDSFAEWSDYTDIDGNVEIFDGNTDTTTPVRSVLAEQVFTPGIRIYPTEWVGDFIEIRIELTGCDSTRHLDCAALGDMVSEVKEGETIQAECPGLCPFIEFPTIYGTGIYSGSSQICNAAVHAGVIIDRFGGPVTVMRKPGQSTYTGSTKNTITSRDLDYYPVAFAFTNNEKNCEAGWMPYLSHCYWISDYGTTWLESEAVCESLGGHLVSVYDQVEQDYLTQMVHMHEYQRIWLGLTELQTPNTYEWSDNEAVTFTNWMPGEPNNHEGAFEKCVHLYRDTGEVTIAGKWNDVDCQETAGFVCKKFKAYYTEDEAAHPTPAPGCKEGWIAYDYMCYHFHKELATEEEAEEYCEANGGVTVHISNKYTQSFLHTAIGAEDLRWWLGLHAVVSSETGTSWVWESGDPIVYDNWGPNNPTVAAGECAVMYGGPYGYGLWYSNRCDKQAYVICEASREGFTPPPPTTPPSVGGCYHDWVTPSADSGFCYKIYSPTSEGDYDHKQSWTNAYHQCTALNADLVSIHSSDEEEYLIAEMSKLPLVTDKVWIGLNNRGDGDWMWSDGSSIQFFNWKLGSPSSTLENNCVGLQFNSINDKGLWENMDCQTKLDWICKIPKGIEVVEPTNPPTGVEDPTCGDSADGLWMKFDDSCYLFNNGTSYGQHESERVCNAKGGYLASIHSPREQSFIANVIKDISTDRFWIGLKEIGGVNGEYLWSDSTPLDYVHWNYGEPNDGAGMEQCVFMYNTDGRWNDANCGIKIAGFICKTYPNGPPISPPPTSPATGGCPAGWFLYNNDCYKLMGDIESCDVQVTGDDHCAADFGTAQLKCVDHKANLVTIHDKYENAFLTAQSYRATNNIWIGLSSYTWNNKPFVWANGDEVTYTNWFDGEPNSVDGAENCVEIYRSEAIAGRWNDVNCDNNVPYFCSKRRDSTVAMGQEINNNQGCPSGWIQYDAPNNNKVCYYMESEMMTFDDAQQNCKSKGGDLVSLHSTYEQAFLTSVVKDQAVWIGMRLNPDTSEYIWVDGWPVWVTNWGEYEPGSDANKNCVLNMDSTLGSEWMTASCADRRMSVCKTSTETIPTTPGYVEGYCEDSSWQQLGGYCYFVFSTAGNTEDNGVSWGDAQTMCEKSNGNLASFAHRSELEWVLDWYNYTEAVWIGLISNGQGGWTWSDYRPVSFINWATGEPNNYGEEGEDCVEMMPDGKWNDHYCLTKRGYICRIPKVVGTDDDGNVIHYTTPAPPEKNDTGGNNAGVIAGAVIGAIVAIAIVVGVAVYCTRNPSTMSKLADDVSKVPTGIVNNLYSVSSPSKNQDKSDVEIKFDKDNGARFDSEA